MAAASGPSKASIHPPDVVVGQRITGHEQPLLGLPQRQVTGRVAWGADHLPVGVTEPQDLSVLERLVDGVGGDGLVEVLGDAAARVPPGDCVCVRGAGGDPGAAFLQQRVPADVVGVPVGVDDHGDLAEVGARRMPPSARRGRRSRCRRRLALGQAGE